MAKEFHTTSGSPDAGIVLTPDELHALTGTMQSARQTQWLEERQWVFEAPAPGRRKQHPKVDRTYYLARMSGAELPTARAKPRLGLFGKN